MKRKQLISRELSWLSFNERVLQEAQDKNVPLIERVRFLGIFSNNQDEFFKVRVAAVKRMLDIKGAKFEGQNPRDYLNQIQAKVINLQKKFEETYDYIFKELREENIFIINETQLNKSQQKFVEEYFLNNVLPVIFPILLDNVKNLPPLRDKSIYLAIKLTSKLKKVKEQYALIELPTEMCPRFVAIPSPKNKHYIILLDDIIRYSLFSIFSNLKFDDFKAWVIKITRDAQLDIDNDLSKSFLEKISTGVTERKKGQPVRFVFDCSIAPDLLRYLIKKLDLDDDDNPIPGGRYHNFKDFMSFPDIGNPKLLYPNSPPLKHKSLNDKESYFDSIDKGDIMLHCPYHSFLNIINLLREASIDPNVKEIFITVYRVSFNSSVMSSLINALQNGKKVTVCIELQARFDEERNIYWSKRLQESGAKVVFGVSGLKVHGKLILINRIENNISKLYGCVSTGNFHEKNAQVYTDLNLLTSDVRITGEIAKVFDFFENTYKQFQFNHLQIAPLNMREKICKLIDNEIKNAKAKRKAFIQLKINNLIDEEIIQKLYQASNSGVKISIIVRGTCSLIPGVKGLSENIQAISIVDKYLEHSRIYVFYNGGDPLYYISSADWMTRNLDWRIEVACPIYDNKIKKELQYILDIELKDNSKARIIDVGQTNKYKKGVGGKKIRSQEELYKFYNTK